MSTLPRMTQPFVVPGTDTWMEDDLHVTLAVPACPGAAALLVLLDGQSMFLTAAEYARTVTLVTMGALPPITIAPMWHASDDPLDYFSTRFHDFTPYEWVLPAPFDGDNTMARHGTGGAAFADLIVDRVLPAVRERADIGEVSIGGWSLSGLFADVGVARAPGRLPAPDRDLPVALVVRRPDPRRGTGPAGRFEGVPRRASAEQATCHACGRSCSRTLPSASTQARNAVRYGEICAEAGVDTDTVVFADEHHVTLVPASLHREHCATCTRAPEPPHEQPSSRRRRRRVRSRRRVRRRPAGRPRGCPTSSPPRPSWCRGGWPRVSRS